MPLALEARIAIAALLAVSIALAVLGPVPRRARPGLAGALLGGSLALYVTGALALADERLLAGGVIVALAGEAMCGAAWLGRFRALPPPDDVDAEADGPDDPGSDQPPDPPHWQDFETAFRRYEAERRDTPVP